MPENNYFIYGDKKLGKGNFDLPPVLIGTMFYQGQIFVDRKNSEIFDKQKAKKRIDTQKKLSEQYHIPELIEISAITPEAMLKYLEFYLDNYNPPFVLGGTFEARAAGVEYLKERGVGSDEYNIAN